MRNKTVLIIWILLQCAAVVLTGCSRTTGWVERDGELFCFDENGDPVSGWLQQEEKRYYLSDEGKAFTGFQLIDGNTYYFAADGSMSTGWLEENGAFYYFRGNGTQVTGWLSLEGQKYYLTEDGSAATGICTVDGSAYVFDKTGKLTSGWADLGDSRAYGDENCHPLIGWHEIDGKKLYFNETGLLRTGWTEIDGFWYYYREDGSPAQGHTIIEDKNYTFASNGQLTWLVNPWNYVPEGYTVELTSINEDHKIASVAYADYREMMEDCKNTGMEPVVCSSYRTQAYQEGLFRNKIERVLEENPDCSPEEARAAAAMVVAVPGTSEHQLGLAIDIVDNRNWNLDETQAEMPTQQWLMENSWRYGWILRYPNEKSEITGIIYEPWHYRYVGRDVAAEIHSLGICLEEYLLMLTPAVG